MNTEFKSNRKPETRLQTRQDVSASNCLLTHICYCWSRWCRCWLCADSFSNVFFNLLNVSTWLIGCLKRSGCLTVSLPSHIVRLPSASPLLPSPSASIFKFSDFPHLIASCFPLSVSSVILFIPPLYFQSIHLYIDSQHHYRQQRQPVNRAVTPLRW